MSAPTLTLSSLAAGYRGRDAGTEFVVGNIDARIEPGRLVCILGPNGSGKSTLLRTIAGFQAPLAGEILFEGRSIRELTVNERARFVSVVLTDRIDAGMLDGRELVSLGRYPYTSWMGGLSAEDLRVVDWALEAVGALELASRPVISLSDGERQKIMIARALAQQPRLVLLDEPTAFLDLPRKVEVMTLLGRLARETGCSVLLTTHELEIAQSLADRLWLIRPEVASRRSSLLAGSPEDLVLSGDFERIFSTAGVQFDRELGRFFFGRRPQRKVILRGSGLPRRWTEHALGRIGLQSMERDEPERARKETPVITVQNVQGGYLWTLTDAGTTQGFNSISDLIAALDDGGKLE